MKEYADAPFFQPLAEPLGIRVEQLTAGDFVTDGENFGVHFVVLSARLSSQPVHLLQQVGDRTFRVNVAGSSGGSVPRG
jgi:hypothetical protein